MIGSIAQWFSTHSVPILNKAVLGPFGPNVWLSHFLDMLLYRLMMLIKSGWWELIVDLSVACVVGSDLCCCN